MRLAVAKSGTSFQEKVLQSQTRIEQRQRSAFSSYMIMLLTAFGLLYPVESLLAVDNDPLPSWSEGATKQAVKDFVKDVTKGIGGYSATPANERIATFDNDGTLTVEMPEDAGHSFWAWWSKSSALLYITTMRADKLIEYERHWLEAAH